MGAIYPRAMQRAVDGEQTLRISGFLRFIHGAPFQCHRHRVRLVRARIVKSSIDQNGHRDQNHLPAFVEFQNSYSSRLPSRLRLLVLLWLVLLWDNLRLVLLRKTLPGARQEPGADDG